MGSTGLPGVACRTTAAPGRPCITAKFGGQGVWFAERGSGQAGPQRLVVLARLFMAPAMGTGMPKTHMVQFLMTFAGGFLFAVARIKVIL